MGVLSKVSAVSRRQALRTLRKGLDMLRRRKHGTTGRLALPHQHRHTVKLVRPSVQLPAGDPRMARFIRVLAPKARESGPTGISFPSAGNRPRLDTTRPRSV